MKLYLDEDLSPRVAEGLRKRGRDVVSSHEAGNDELPDEAQLSYATESERHLVTYNRRDYLVLADQWYRAGRHFPKILLMRESRYPRHAIGAQVRALERYVVTRADDPNMMDCVDYL